MQLEKRYASGELRAEQSGGRTYLRGTAAVFNTLSHDLGGWREKILPGAFDDVLASPDLDVVHVLDHDSSRLLGKTKSGTLKLGTNKRGLTYRTELPNTSYARDVAELARRGDVSSSSFAFVVDPSGESWSEIPDPDDDNMRCGLRTISRIASLHDVSTLTGSSPAYPKTAAELAHRSVPVSMPQELRNKLMLRAAGDDEDNACTCECPECLAGDCSDCSNVDCDSENCRECPYSSEQSADDGEADRARRLRLELARDEMLLR